MLLNTENFDSYSQALQETLTAQEKSDHSLPNLVSEKNALSDFFQKIIDWWHHLFGSSKKTSSVVHINFFEILFILFVIVLIAVIIYFLVKNRRKIISYFALSSSDDLGVIFQDREAFMIEKIKEAQKSSEWAKAARLRWKLLLERLKSDADSTPQEFSFGELAPEVIRKENKKLVAQENELMFGKKTNPIQDYQSLDEIFLKFEETSSNKYAK